MTTPKKTVTKATKAKTPVKATASKTPTKAKTDTKKANGSY